MYIYIKSYTYYAHAIYAIYYMPITCTCICSNIHVHNT